MKVQVTMENQDMMVQSHTVKVSNHDQLMRNITNTYFRVLS